MVCQNQTDDLWVRVECDPDDAGGEYVKVYNATDANGLDSASPCFTVDASASPPLDGGMIGFAGHSYSVWIDDLTVRSWNGSAWVTEVEQDFEIDGDGYAAHKPGHDAAGNMTRDGVQACTYDAWNRLAGVARACGDANTSSTIATIEYDGLHRRTTKEIAGCGNWDCTYRYFYDTSWRLLETRNGSGRPIKQHLWGPRYVDELVQIAVNTDPSDPNEQDCEAHYYAAQNANFNVLGLIDANGTLAERYEYTPYGQRTVYKKAGTADTLTFAALFHSQPVIADGTAQPYSLCDIGHQGLMHEKEFGLIRVRRRYLHPATGRWAQRDPAGYVDAQNLYLPGLASPETYMDPSGSYVISGLNSVKLILSESKRGIDYIGTKKLRAWSPAAGDLSHWLGLRWTGPKKWARIPRSHGEHRWLSAPYIRSREAVVKARKRIVSEYVSRRPKGLPALASDAKRGFRDYWDTKVVPSPLDPFYFASGKSVLQAQVLLACARDDAESQPTKPEYHGYIRFVWFDLYDWYSDHGFFVKLPGKATVIHDSAFIKVRGAGKGWDYYMWSVWLEKVTCKWRAGRLRCTSVVVRGHRASPSTSPASQPAYKQNVPGDQSLAGAPSLPTVSVDGRTVHWGKIDIISKKHKRNADSPPWWFMEPSD